MASDQTDRPHQTSSLSGPALPDPPRIKLGARHVHRRFGRVQANRDISLSVAAGSIHAIVGQNGAGKTTLMRILQGMDLPDSGSVVVDDREVALSGPGQALALGIGMVHQEFMLVPELTLLENLVLGAEPLKPGPLGRLLVDWETALDQGRRLAAQAGLKIDWQAPVSRVPVHIRQVLEIIRLLYRGARTLILDEPTAVLAPRQVEDLFALIRALNRSGTTILFTSHKLNEVMALAGHISVLRRGELVATRAQEETDPDELARLMVGEAIAAPNLHGSRFQGAQTPALKLSGLKAYNDRGVMKVRGLDLEVRSGEILGIAGVAGNGQDELAECAAGLRLPASGRIELEGRDVTRLGNAGRRALGLGYISADRANEGLAIKAGISENVIAGRHRSPDLSRRGWFRPAAVKTVAEQALKRFGVLYGRLGDPVGSLSGGNQQRLVLARELFRAPRVLIATQPTRGVDIKGIAFIHQVLIDYRDQGGAVLLISEELEELLALSDRIAVLAGGKPAGILSRDQADLTRLGQLMTIHGELDDAA